MKNNPVNRIKLLMSYEMGKTLEENLKSNPVINEEESVEEESDINELGGEAGLAKDLLGAAKTEEKLAHLAQFFKVGEDVVKMANAKDLTTLGKDLDKAIAADIKAGFKGGGQALGENAKNVAKQMAIKEILASNKALSEQDIIQIIERIKTQSKLKAATKEGVSATSAAAKATKAGAKDAKAAESEVKAAVTDATQQQAAGTLETALKNPENKEVAGILGKSKEVVKGMSDKAFSKFKRISKYLAAKYIIMLGLAGTGAYLVAKSLFGGNTNPQDPKNNLFPKCINDLLDDEGTTVGYDGAGAPVVIVKTTGNEEYDKLGGLKFFLNNRVVSGDGTKKGTWSCKDNSTLEVKEDVELNEQGNEITLTQMTDFVDDAVDDLDGFVAVYNLKSLKNILTQLAGKTYKGKNAVQAFMDFYKQDEGGDDFIADVNSVGVRTLGVEGMELKDEVLKLAQGAGTSTGDGNTKTGIGGIDIKWDGEENPTPPPPPVPPVPEKTKYHDCSNKDFPLEFGCISPKIAEIQTCLGVFPQKGYFGPKTQKTLKDLQYDMSQGITLDIYDSVKSNCGEEKVDDTRKKLTPAEPIGLERTKLGNIKAPTSSISLKDLENKIKPIEKTPAEVYQSIKDAGLIVGEDGNNRIKYKGPTPGDDILGKLDTALSDMGYDRIKQLEDVKRYGSKYVWLKR
jgi:hypothetical protein